MTVIYQLNQFLLNFFTTFFTWLVNRAEDVLRLSSNILLICFPFVFRLKKKKMKNIVILDPRHGTLDPRPSTLDIKMDSFAGKRFLLSPRPPPSLIFFFFCSCPNILDELGRKRLLRRLISFGFRTCVLQFL